jgi:alkylated DNA repair dioxygenase AlkB
MNGAYPDLFGQGSSPPTGFIDQENLVSPAEERDLLEKITILPFREFEFHGYVGKCRVVSFGWEYDFSKRRVYRVEDLPTFLLPLRDRAASFEALPPSKLSHALATEYQAGAPIGWHKDKAVFADVIGVSLLSPCVFPLRRKNGASWERAPITAEPCSVYLLRGPVRTKREHSIPAVESLHYSIAFRTLRSQ